MPELEILKNRVDNIETDVKSNKEDIEDLEERTVRLSDRAHALEIWRGGNGAKGAEARLQSLEVCMDQTKEAILNEASITMIAATAVEKVVESAKFRDKSMISKIKAYAPYFAALCGLAAGLIAALGR